jgi:predicted transcriptional regulator
MTTLSIPVGPATEARLRELAARTGRPVAEMVAAAVEEYFERTPAGVTSIPGVDPADVWEAAAQADAGRLIDHDELFARLRSK